MTCNPTCEWVVGVRSSEKCGDDAVAIVGSGSSSLALCEYHFERADTDAFEIQEL